MWNGFESETFFEKRSSLNMIEHIAIAKAAIPIISITRTK